MAKINDKELGNLLNALAAVLESQVSEVQDELDEAGLPTGNKYYTATPALLTVAARFLKDNNITCAVSDSKGMQGLKDKLAERKKHGKVFSIKHLSPEDEQALGG